MQWWRVRSAWVAVVLLGVSWVGATERGPQLPALGDPAAAVLTPAAERRLGEALMRHVRRQPWWLDDAELEDYLSDVMARLWAPPEGGGQRVVVFAIDDGSINALAFPGGFIGVHRGVIDAAGSESELASVLAHELAHVLLRHSARMRDEPKHASVAIVASLLMAAVAARSNPQAAIGTAMLGAQAAQGAMLSFSREAEREADREGLARLTAGGFDPQAMVAFFGRLQQARRYQSAQVPPYWLTHPLTSERMADLQGRVSPQPPSPRPDSLAFKLLRARLRATADESVLARQRMRDWAELQVRERPEEGGEVWFGLACVALAQGDEARAAEALAQAQQRIQTGHPYLEALAVQLRLRAQDPEGAAQRAERALARWPTARSLARLEVAAWLAAGKPRRAQIRAQAHLEVWPHDHQLWMAQARAYHQMGQRALAHQATAQAYEALGSFRMALEQLRLAQAAEDADFYHASIIDARIRRLEGAVRQERADDEDLFGRAPS